MTSTTTARGPFATPAEVGRHGTSRVPPQRPDDPRPLYRFAHRLTRDGPSGWAFRETNGPDPVSVPTLWDTETDRIVSNDDRTLGLDLAPELPGPRHPGTDTWSAFSAPGASPSFLPDRPADATGDPR